MFKKRENVAAIEEGKLLSPKFDKDGNIIEPETLEAEA